MAIIRSAQGKISGIGDVASRTNEITPDDLAAVRNFIVGYYSDLIGAIGGIIKSDNHDFNCTFVGTKAAITDGVCFAYGYFGLAEAVEFDILPPAVEQYQVIYVELDKSVIPNTCKIKIKNNQSSPTVQASSFRQDELSTIKTGVFQMPLWLLKVTNQGIEKKQDLRNLRSSIEQVFNTDFCDKIMDGGSLGENVYCPLAAEGDISKKIANTEFTTKAIDAEINK